MQWSNYRIAIFAHRRPNSAYTPFDSSRSQQLRATALADSLAVTPPFQQIGLNTLYVYSAYGNEGTSAGAYNQTGNSPEIGNIIALQYLIEPVATTTTLTADHTSQGTGATVNFTASLTPASPPANALASGPSDS
jgi:hypothetical protein